MSSTANWQCKKCTYANPWSAANCQCCLAPEISPSKKSAAYSAPAPAPSVAKKPVASPTVYNCTACTFENLLTVASCEMCGQANANYKPPAQKYGKKGFLFKLKSEYSASLGQNWQTASSWNKRWFEVDVSDASEPMMRYAHKQEKEAAFSLKLSNVKRVSYGWRSCNANGTPTEFAPGSAEDRLMKSMFKVHTEGRSFVLQAMSPDDAVAWVTCFSQFSDAPVGNNNAILQSSSTGPTSYVSQPYSACTEAECKHNEVAAGDGGRALCSTHKRALAKTTTNHNHHYSKHHLSAESETTTAPSIDVSVKSGSFKPVAAPLVSLTTEEMVFKYKENLAREEKEKAKRENKGGVTIGVKINAVGGAKQAAVSRASTLPSYQSEKERTEQRMREYILAKHGAAQNAASSSSTMSSLQQLRQSDSRSGVDADDTAPQEAFDEELKRQKAKLVIARQVRQAERAFAAAQKAQAANKLPQEKSATQQVGDEQVARASVVSNRVEKREEKEMKKVVKGLPSHLVIHMDGGCIKMKTSPVKASERVPVGVQPEGAGLKARRIAYVPVNGEATAFKMVPQLPPSKFEPKFVAVQPPTTEGQVSPLAFASSPTRNSTTAITTTTNGAQRSAFAAALSPVQKKAEENKLLHSYKHLAEEVLSPINRKIPLTKNQSFLSPVEIDDPFAHHKFSQALSSDEEGGDQLGFDSDDASEDDVSDAQEEECKEVARVPSAKKSAPRLGEESMCVEEFMDIDQAFQLHAGKAAVRSWDDSIDDITVGELSHDEQDENEEEGEGDEAEKENKHSVADVYTARTNALYSAPLEQIPTASAAAAPVEKKASQQRSAIEDELKILKAQRERLMQIKELQKQEQKQAASSPAPLHANGIVMGMSPVGGGHGMGGGAVRKLSSQLSNQFNAAMLMPKERGANARGREKETTPAVKHVHEEFISPEVLDDESESQAYQGGLRHDVLNRPSMTRKGNATRKSSAKLFTPWTTAM